MEIIISLIQKSYRLVLISGSKIKSSKEKKYAAKQTAHTTHTLAEILYKMHVSCVVGNFHWNISNANSALVVGEISFPVWGHVHKLYKNSYILKINFLVLMALFRSCQLRTEDTRKVTEHLHLVFAAYHLYDFNWSFTLSEPVVFKVRQQSKVKFLPLQAAEWHEWVSQGKLVRCGRQLDFRSP